MKYILLLILLGGCVVDSEVFNDADEVELVDESPRLPEGAEAGRIGGPSGCGSIIQIIKVDGVEIEVEIPVECDYIEIPGDDFRLNPFGEKGYINEHY